MFNAAKSLLFGCGEQFAVAHDASCGVGMVGIDPEDLGRRHILTINIQSGILHGWQRCESAQCLHLVCGAILQR